MASRLSKHAASAAAFIAFLRCVVILCIQHAASKKQQHIYTYVHDNQHGYMLAESTWGYVASEHADL